MAPPALISRITPDISWILSAYALSFMSLREEEPSVPSAPNRLMMTLVWYRMLLSICRRGGVGAAIVSRNVCGPVTIGLGTRNCYQLQSATIGLPHPPTHPPQLVGIEGCVDGGCHQLSREVAQPRRQLGNILTHALLWGVDAAVHVAQLVVGLWAWACTDGGAELQRSRGACVPRQRLSGRTGWLPARHIHH